MNSAPDIALTALILFVAVAWPVVLFCPWPMPTSRLDWYEDFAGQFGEGEQR